MACRTIPPAARVRHNDTEPTLQLAVAGLGAIGYAVACAVDAGKVPGISLAAVAAKDHAKVHARLAGFPQAVCGAIEEQYLPDAAEGPLPQTEPGRVLAAAEKIDNLTVAFALGQIQLHEDAVDVLFDRPLGHP